MIKSPDRLLPMFKSAAQLRIARDFLEAKLLERPDWIDGESAEALAGLQVSNLAPAVLAHWCSEWLGVDQLRTLQKALRLASNHQRVYKRTVMLSPRAHLLIKTLAEQDGIKMSDAIEQHLDGILRERYAMSVRTSINELTGQVEHAIVSAVESGLSLRQE
jgi:hypothetical protein